VSVPFFLKLLPLTLTFSFFLLLFIFLRIFTFSNQLSNSYFSRIMFLYFFFTKLIRSCYYRFSFRFVKRVEVGLLDSSLNSKLPSFFYSLGRAFLKFSIVNPFLLSLLFSSAFLFFLFLFVRSSSYKPSVMIDLYYRGHLFFFFALWHS
jgi:hypothetical protein